MIKNIVKAYIAGLVDGEGCIAITRRKIKRLSTNNWYYEPQVIVANTDKRMVDFLAGLYQGWIATPKKLKYYYKQGYHWKITGDNMRQLLRDVLPHLVIKKKQAELILSFPAYNETGKPRTTIEKQQQRSLWLKMKGLNK